MDVLTDAELLAASRTDARAFRELYDRHAETIHRFHLGRTRQREAALDLTAETFAQAWLSRGRFRDLAGGSALPWLYAIARNVLRASVRKRVLERTTTDRLGVLLEADRPAAPVEPDDVWLDGLDDALAELDPDVRAAIELRVVDELDVRRGRDHHRHDARRRTGPRAPRPACAPLPASDEGGNPMTDRNPQLVALGDALESAARADLAPRHRRISRRLVVAFAALVVAVPGLAFAADALISPEEVAAGLPAGTKMLAGTEPRCTVVEAGVEYHCVLTRLPASPEVSDLTGTVEPTVDATKHVNGGCRSLSSDGREWRCYLGEAAVEQQIISRGFLGEYAPEPGVG